VKSIVIHVNFKFIIKLKADVKEISLFFSKKTHFFFIMHVEHFSSLDLRLSGYLFKTVPRKYKVPALGVRWGLHLYRCLLFCNLSYLLTLVDDDVVIS